MTTTKKKPTKPAKKKAEPIFETEPNEKRPITPKQELFCQLYATEREFFGNGTQAYIEAYNVPATKYKSAQAAASRLLSNVIILQRIDTLLEEMLLNDQHVDKQLGFWITQKANPQAAVAAIKEYNALKSRVTKKLKLEGDVPVALVRFFGEGDGTDKRS